jgi:hypothetical protein
LIALVLVLVLTRGQSALAAPALVRRVQIALPPGVEPYTSTGTAASLSPDGSTFALVGIGIRRVFLRRLDQFEITPVRGTESAGSCVFSPDGRELLVGVSDSSLFRIRLSDGLIQTIAPPPSAFWSAWLPNGRAVFTKDGRLWMSGQTPGAAATQLTEAQAGSTASESQPVPEMMSVRLTDTPAGPGLTPPVELFSGRYAFGGGTTIPNFSVTSDRERFILVKESGASLNVVLNWFEELKRVR